MRPHGTVRLLNLTRLSRVKKVGSNTHQIQHFLELSRIIARMTDSKRSTKTIALTLRLPLSTHAELTDIAKAKGWSLNDEINFRLRSFSLHEQMRSVANDVADIKTILKRSLDKD